MTAEDVAEQIMHAAAEHVFVSAECAEDREHPCVILWSESAREHIGAMIQRYADEQKEMQS